MKMAPLDAFDAFNTCFPELYKTAVNGIDFFPLLGAVASVFKQLYNFDSVVGRISTTSLQTFDWQAGYDLLDSTIDKFRSAMNSCEVQLGSVRPMLDSAHYEKGEEGAAEIRQPVSIVGCLAPKFSIMSVYPDSVAKPAIEKFVRELLSNNIKEFEAPLIELAMRTAEEGEKLQDSEKPGAQPKLPKWVLDVVTDLGAEGEAPVDLQKWKAVRIKVAPCKQLMKNYEKHLDIEKKFQQLLKKVGPGCADARQLVQEDEEVWAMFMMAVKTLGGCVVTQACTKKLKDNQTRAGELLLVNKFWKDAQVEMPRKFEAVIGSASH